MCLQTRKSKTCCRVSKNMKWPIRRDGAESGQGLPGSRLVGADEEWLNPWITAKLKASRRLISARGSCSRCWRGAQISCGGSLRQSKGRALTDRFPLGDYIWWVSLLHSNRAKGRKKQCNWWCAVVGGQYNRRDPNRGVWLHRTVRISARRRCFGLTLRRRMRARILCVLSNCWPICKRVETTWWARSSRVSSSKADST